MKNTIVFLQIIILFSSCVNKKFIYQNNTLFRTNVNPSLVTTQTKINVDDGFKCNITEKSDYLLISKVDVNCITDGLIHTFTNPPLWVQELDNKYYFSDNFIESEIDKTTKLTYFDSKPVLQGMSIPLKIRKEMTAENTKFPQQVETGFNVGFALGWKFSHNVYNINKNIFSQNLNKWTFSSGLLLGTGAVDLTKKNTINKIEFERKAGMITTGIFAMIGFNNINIGYSIGNDKTFGPESKTWVYYGKRWQGITVSLDILK